MRREKDRLVFELNERDKFFRAIRLFLNLKGHSKAYIEDTVKHEQDHIEAIERLEYTDRIRGYYLAGKSSGIFVDEQGMLKRRLAEIRLAPDRPSIPDVLSVVSRGDRIRYFFGKLNLQEIRRKYVEY